MFADVAFEFPANPQAGVNPIVAKWGKFKQDDINIASAGEFQAAVNPIVAKWGKFKQDDINIASAGEFQAAATRLADRAGYK